jgi:hypothetical protein
MIRLIAKVSFTAFLLSVTAGAVAQAADDCKIATKGDSPTAKACAKGGRAEAKKVMKQMVQAAKDNKENKQKFTCDGCHKDLDSYELTANARDDYKKLEAASGKK